MKRLWMWLPVFLVGVMGAGTWAADAPASKGLVQEKPASGPYVEVEQGFMVPYTETIPGTNVTFEMVPIPGGTFKMGSPADEEGRSDNEGPQFEVVVEPFWMGKYEVTWAEYREFLRLVDIFIDFRGFQMRMVTDENKVDAITAPSNLYDPTVTFTHGENPRLPAATMTAFAAKQYTKYISKLTGRFYRLPGEAEWEYAARAGTTTPYFFGDDPADLDDYAWWFDNSDSKTHLVGQKKPNPWGLYDIYGNVAELTLDGYKEDHFKQFAGKTVTAWEAIAWPTEMDNRVYKGGSYDDFEEDLRSARRRGTEGDAWKVDDPNLPRSAWWYADPPSLVIGFRVMRPLAAPTAEMQRKAWDEEPEATIYAAQTRISEGRGSWGLVDEDLPKAIEELRERKAQR